MLGDLKKQVGELNYHRELGAESRYYKENLDAFENTPDFFIGIVAVIIQKLTLQKIHRYTDRN